MNAVHDASRRVTLIDWDRAGRGLAIFDLAYLLLTSHYDLSKPLEVVPDKPIVEAIIAGYTTRRPVSNDERAMLFDAVRLVIAFAAARHYTEHDVISADDFVMRKIKARFEATEGIARIADQSFGRTVM